LASPLSEIAYQLANTGAGAIDPQNTAVATAFGISGVDIVSTTPTDINTTAATCGFIRVSTTCASHSNKPCWYVHYTYQIDLTITTCGSSA
jgi:hypothetical protein